MYLGEPSVGSGSFVFLGSFFSVRSQSHAWNPNGIIAAALCDGKSEKASWPGAEFLRETHERQASDWY